MQYWTKIKRNCLIHHIILKMSLKPKSSLKKKIMQLKRGRVLFYNEGIIVYIVYSDSSNMNEVTLWYCEVNSHLFFFKKKVKWSEFGLLRSHKPVVTTGYLLFHVCENHWTIHILSSCSCKYISSISQCLVVLV